MPLQVVIYYEAWSAWCSTVSNFWGPGMDGVACGTRCHCAGASRLRVRLGPHCVTFPFLPAFCLQLRTRLESHCIISSFSYPFTVIFWRWRVECTPTPYWNTMSVKSRCPLLPVLMRFLIGRHIYIYWNDHTRSSHPRWCPIGRNAPDDARGIIAFAYFLLTSLFLSDLL